MVDGEGMVILGTARVSGLTKLNSSIDIGCLRFNLPTTCGAVNSVSWP